MGKIIVIEGTDCSGKETQSKMLVEKIKRMGLSVIRQSFPNYDSPSSSLVKMYLGGEFGESANNLDAYQASVLYAVDRLATMVKLKKFYEEGGVIVLDRYVQSNMLHQAGKISDLEKRDEYLAWLDELEFETLKLPRADLVVFLDVPIEVSTRLKAERKLLKTGGTKDVHERDEKHLRDAYNSGKYVSKKYGWAEIACTKDGNMLSVDEIAEKIFKEALKVLK